MSEISSDRPVTVIMQHRERPGLIAGLFGCALGLLGFFAFGFILAPLGFLCAIVGVVSGVIGRSGTGVGTSMLAGVLSFVAAIKSPALWFIFGVAMLGSLLHPPHNAVQAVSAAPATQAEPTATAPPVMAGPTTQAFAQLPAPTDAQPPAQSEVQARSNDASPSLAEVSHVLGWVTNFNVRTDNVLMQLSGATDRSSAAIAQIQSYSARLNSFMPMLRVQRAQLVNAVSQDQAMADQFHNQVSALRGTFDRDIVPSSAKVHDMLSRCKTPDLAPEIANQCDQLSPAAQTFDVKYAALGDGLNQAEAAYQQGPPLPQPIAGAPATP